MKPSEVDLNEAANLYMVANTPLFLIRRLQNDPGVLAIARYCSSHDIFSSLVVSLTTPPEDPVDAVRPFAYLIALRTHDTPELFLKAAEMPSAYLPWYKVVARMLEATFIPNVNMMISATPSPSMVQYSMPNHLAVESSELGDVALSC